MGRMIALAIVAAAIWWMWKRWQGGIPAKKQSKSNQPQRLSQCVRCDAMLPSEPSERQEVAHSCDQGERCPLKQEQ